ncbi:hypothetical protein [Kitasatospora sp. LaBMicrA B282]
MARLRISARCAQVFEEGRRAMVEPARVVEVLRRGERRPAETAR